MLWICVLLSNCEASSLFLVFLRDTHSFHFGVQRFAKLLCMLTRKIQMVIILEAVYFSPTCIIICKSKFTLTFKKKKKKKGTFKVSVNQFQVVVHAAGNATFALCVQLNL